MRHVSTVRSICNGVPGCGLRINRPGRTAGLPIPHPAATYPVASRCSGMPSSVIRHYAYDPVQRRLDIAFMSGQAYSYFDVPEATFHGLTRARSKGRYFKDHIRSSFACRRDRTGRLYKDLCGQTAK